jgi:hypothetical protein
MFSRLRSLQAILSSDHKDELFDELKGIIVENGGEEGIEVLVQACRDADYRLAGECLDDLMKLHRPPVLKGDIDLSGYRTAYRLLETRLSVLSQKKLDILRNINAFRLRHNQEVGGIMARLLFLRKEILMLSLKDDPRREAEQKDAEKEYETWTRESSRAIDPVKGVNDHKLRKELAALYRKISKRCHPDLVNDEQRLDAERIFQMLNRAYVNADLDEMKRLDALIEGGQLNFALKDTEVSELSRLSVRVQRLESEVNSLLREIVVIEESAIWQLISTLEDQDAYFDQVKRTLERELASLELEYEQRRQAAAQ